MQIYCNFLNKEKQSPLLVSDCFSWSCLGLNQGPPDYESGATNQLSYRTSRWNALVALNSPCELGRPRFLLLNRKRTSNLDFVVHSLWLKISKCYSLAALTATLSAKKTNATAKVLLFFEITKKNKEKSKKICFLLQMYKKNAIFAHYLRIAYK